MLTTFERNSINNKFAKFIVFAVFCFVFTFIPFGFNEQGIERFVVKAGDAYKFTIMPVTKDGKPITKCLYNGLPEYTFCDGLMIFIRIGRIIMYVSASVVMLMLVISGLIFVTAQGSSEKIQQGKKVIRNALVGLAIILLAYEVVGVIYTTLLPGGDVTKSEGANVSSGVKTDKSVFNAGWWNFKAIVDKCECKGGSSDKWAQNPAWKEIYPGK